jgi:hypothetical protein
MKSDSKQSNWLAAISDSIGDRMEMEEWNLLAFTQRPSKPTETRTGD